MLAVRGLALTESYSMESPQFSVRASTLGLELQYMASKAKNVFPSWEFEILQCVCIQDGLPFSKEASTELRKLILGMLHPDPRLRLNVSDVITAPWMKAARPWQVDDLTQQELLLQQRELLAHQQQPVRRISVEGSNNGHERG